jgi:hypothetical protein
MIARIEKTWLFVTLTCWLGLAFAQAPSPAPAQLEQPVSAGNVLALLAFELIKPDLPPSTRLSSGFRTAQDQVEIIRQYARHEGISTSGINSNDPGAWLPILQQLRSAGYIIAEPGKSPHSNPDLIVLDLSRASLSEILAGCNKANRRGVIQLSRTIKEHKNGAVHIELQITAGGLEKFGVDPELARNRSSDRDFEQRAIGQLREKSREEVDPQKRIGLLQDLQREVGFGNPVYQLLEGDIVKSRQEVQQLELQQQKRDALKAISDAREQGNWENAVQKANEFVEAHPEAPEARTIVQKIEAQSLYQKAVEIAYPEGEEELQCENCSEAMPLIEKAIETLKPLNLSRTTEEKFQARLASRISRCRSQFWLKTTLWTMASLLTLVGLFFAFRPGKMFLRCEEGDQRGESFELNQPELIIGSLGAPDGEAQIVINDRKRKISRSHCAVRRSGRRYYLKDLNSANGVLVNGRRLGAGEYHELKKGDEISLAGAATLIVRRR